MKNSIYDQLKKYAESSPLRMHMPGHKGNTSLMPFSDIDITEITGFDNLHNSCGIIRESMDLASKLWGSKKSFYLVNGSTCGILSAIRALTNPGDKAIIARNCHKAVYNAAELCNLQSIYAMPPKINEWNIFGSVRPEDIKLLLEKHSDVKIVVITSPTYEGVISDIKEIAGIVHAKGARLIVDEAHGAHLGLCGFFEKSSVSYSADIVIQSLHKTLSCPTQTAILHINDLSLEQAVKKQLSVFQTSSPSYLFIALTDAFIRKAAKGNFFNSWTEALNIFYQEANNLKNIEILGLGADSYNEIFAYDKSKIILKSCDNARLSETLKKEYNTELEFTCPDYITAMTGIGDNKATLSTFTASLLKQDASQSRQKKPSRPFIYENPVIYENPSQAILRKSYSEKAENAAGKVCAEYVWEYPPGIPLLIPGEVISENFCINIKKGVYGNLSSDSGNLPENIMVYDRNSL